MLGLVLDHAGSTLDVTAGGQVLSPSSVPGASRVGTAVLLVLVMGAAAMLLMTLFGRSRTPTV